MYIFDIIFVSGVHGVGKSYFCSKIASSFNIPVYSASNLIREEKNSAVDVNKNVLDLEKNQDYLLQAVSKIKTASNKIIIDGHFCLYREKEIVNIPLQVFEKLPLSSIIVLSDFPENIYQRLQQRDKTLFSVEMISEMQERETKQAEYISNSLNTPYKKISFEVVEQFNYLCDIFK